MIDLTSLAVAETEPTGQANLYLVPPLEALTEPNPLPTRIELDEIIDRDGLTTYELVVRELDIPNPEQYQMVMEIERLFAEIDSAKSQGIDASLEKARIDELRHSLYLGNLASVFDNSKQIFRSGHASNLRKIIHASNRWAEDWFNATYKSSRTMRRAPVYPRDIVASDIVGDKLKESFKTGIRQSQFEATRPKPKPKNPPKVKPPSEIVIKETTVGQTYLPRLLGKYVRPPKPSTPDIQPAPNSRINLRITGQLILRFSTRSTSSVKNPINLSEARQSHDTEVSGEDTRSSNELGRQLGIPESNYGDLSRYHQGDYNPNAVAGTTETRAVLDWIRLTYASHPLNSTLTRYRRDFEGFGDEKSLSNVDMVPVFVDGMDPFDYARKFPLLDGASHEIKLANQIQDGIAAQQAIDAGRYENAEELLNLQEVVIFGAGAFQTFFESNIRLVLSQVSKYPENSSYSKSDHFSPGLLGLQRAIELYDPTKGFKFSTYALSWIKQKINRAMADAIYDVKIPAQIIGRFKRITGTIVRLETELQRNPTNQELVNEGFSIEDIVAYRMFNSRNRISMDATLTADGTSNKYDLARFASFDKVDENDEFIESRQQLLDLINATPLTPRECIILSLRWNLMIPGVDYSQLINVDPESDQVPHTLGDLLASKYQDYKLATLEEIGSVVGLTRERCRQISAVAVNKVFVGASLERFCERFNLDETEITLLKAYFSVDAAHHTANIKLFKPQTEQIKAVLDVIKMCEPQVGDYIDEYVDTHYFNDSKRDALRELLRTRLGFNQDLVFTVKQIKELFNIDETIYLSAETYVLSQAAHIISKDATFLDAGKSNVKQ